jgi:allophycocyanin beta subunit
VKDTITAIINEYDTQGKYLDNAAIEKMKAYFNTGALRIRAASIIESEASAILKEATAKSLLYTATTKPGGNMYYTRRYASCIRDMSYFLRYATYAMVAGDTALLENWVLKGLKPMYKSLGVPLPETVNSINALQAAVANRVEPAAAQEMAKYFDYLAKGLS